MSEPNVESSKNPRDTALVLIVDDDVFTRKSLGHVLKNEGYQVIEACNGEQGVEAHEVFHPDIILLDALMPGMDGFTCCHQLRASRNSHLTPILMITALEDAESVEQAFAAGATDYITKPIHWAVLRQRLHRLLEASRASAALQYQTERERLMGTILERVRQSLNLEEILRTAVAEVRQFLQTDRVLLYRCNSEGSGSVIVESVGDDWLPILGMKVPDCGFESTDLLELHQMNKIEAIEDINIANLSSSFRDYLSQIQVKAYLTVPILQENQLWGLLMIHHCSAPRQWRFLEIQLIERLTTQLSIAIQQSTLFGKVQEFNTQLERQVQERTAQLQQALEFEATLKHKAQAHVIELEKLNYLKDEFLNTVSHELRTPMSNMRVAIQLLQHSLPQDIKCCPEVAKANAAFDKSLTYLQILHDSCEQEISLINDLLDLQRVDAESQSLEMTPIEFSDWIDDLIQPFHQRVQERQLSLVLDISPDLPPVVSDPGSLWRVLSELLNNACKYTPPHETITLTAVAKSAMFQLSVINSGVEIPALELPRIFDKFYRIPSVDRWKQGGTGLGLALVKKLVNYLGGCIQVDSTAGQTCFTVELPLESCV